ncbi:MAG: hypothetical protein JSU03_10400 [Bacteroidetes bacterium]|nr:hypothetical protein [Bacteroidota bacterium]MBS1757679.1 hypothetical protein [Bacteroidota bacterium]
MKKIILLFCVCFFSILMVQAQPGRGGEKVQALYIAYVTKQLNLTPDEAQKFWPLHAQYDNEISALSPSMNELDRQQASLNIKKKYQDRFISIIGSDRTNNFFKVDMEFRAKMIERLRKMRQNNLQKRNNSFRLNNN